MDLSAEKRVARDRGRKRRTDPEHPASSAENILLLNPNRVVKILSGIVGLLVLLNLMAVFLWLEGGFDQALGFVPGFNMDKEANVPTFFSGLILLFVCGLSGVIAWYKKKTQQSYLLHWAFLSFVFFYMTLDEVSSFHEHLILPLRNSMNLSGIFYYSWVIVGIVFLLAFVAFYLKFFFSLSTRFRQGFFLAGFIYVAGALGMELIGGYYAEQDGLMNLRYALITTIEETMELIGLIILIKYLLIYLQEQTDLSAIGLKLTK